jgi:hypothetical protein
VGVNLAFAVTIKITRGIKIIQAYLPACSFESGKNFA